MSPLVWAPPQETPSGTCASAGHAKPTPSHASAMSHSFAARRQTCAALRAAHVAGSQHPSSPAIAEHVAPATSVQVSPSQQGSFPAQTLLGQSHSSPSSTMPLPHTAVSPTVRHWYWFARAAALNERMEQSENVSTLSPYSNSHAMTCPETGQSPVPSSYSQPSSSPFPSCANPSWWPISCATVTASNARYAVCTCDSAASRYGKQHFRTPSSMKHMFSSTTVPPITRPQTSRRSQMDVL